MTSSGKVLAGVLTGVAVGALLGVLFAPDRGADTRKKIIKKGGEYAADFRKWCESSLQQFESLKDSVKDNGSDRAERRKPGMEDINPS
jgi:gas vesicle protein